MSALLARRDTRLLEIMDGPCDEERLFASYRRFGVVNRAVSGWRRLYLRRIRPLLDAQRTTSLLDLGFGGGDIPRSLARWAGQDGLRLRITAADPDERAVRFASSRADAGGLRWLRATSTQLAEAGERFDIVTSNHVLHHLDEDERGRTLADSTRLAARLSLHNDIARSPLAYALYAVGALPFAPGSFVRADGLASIRRSFTRAELAEAAPEGWRVEAMRPFRVLLLRDATGSAAAER